MSSLTTALLGTLLLCLGFPSLGAAAPVRDGTLEVLAFGDPLNKFVYVNPNGDFGGFDYHLMEMFAKSLNLELKMVPVEKFGDLIPALVRGEGDIAVGSLTITEERQKLVDFSMPYFPVMEWIIMRRGADPLERLEYLSGLTGSAVPGTSFHQLLESLDGVKILIVDTTEGMYQAVVSGAADFTLDETISALVVLPDYPTLEKALEVPTVHHYGFAMPKGSTLRPAVDRFLNDTASGDSYYRLILRHLGHPGVEAFQSAQGKD